MTCKECIHNEMCYATHTDDSPCCCDFKDRSKYVVREKGEWEVVSEDDYLALYTIKCSKCREEWHFDEEGDVVAMCYHFCPNCGADMRKGENG